jgi:diaminohydroxyphosphoribosylaminopyrimidine deaminase/5-amino-6-(5-phosphoribosylamino)uracil reductase
VILAFCTRKWWLHCKGIFTLPAVTTDEKYMRRCLDLAHAGLGRVAPNPLVGAVVVHNDLIVGEGFHRAYGGPHAEVHALNAVADKAVLAESTLYVNLEPCSHHGKTPPCAALIVSLGISKVVIAQVDPNPLVSGKGIEMLRTAGIEVEIGVLEMEARHLNRRFNTYHSSKRPHILLKWARSADGFMDIDRKIESSSGVHWISHPATKKLVHQWRAHEGAIMVGAATVRNDNPSLTVREVDGKSPLRVVISHSGNLPPDANVLRDGLPTVVINRTIEKVEGPVVWAAFPEGNLIFAALQYLFEHNITSVMVEGGASLLQSLLDDGLWDEARIIQSPNPMGSGLASPIVENGFSQHFTYGSDAVYEYFRI